MPISLVFADWNVAPRELLLNAINKADSKYPLIITYKLMSVRDQIERTLWGEQIAHKEMRFKAAAKTFSEIRDNDPIGCRWLINLQILETRVDLGLRGSIIYVTNQLPKDLSEAEIAKLYSLFTFCNLSIITTQEIDFAKWKIADSRFAALADEVGGT